MKDESVAVQDSKLLCRLAIDVLQALRFIASCGIHHNKITMQNILIQKTKERVRAFSIFQFKLCWLSAHLYRRRRATVPRSVCV